MNQLITCSTLSTADGLVGIAVHCFVYSLQIDWMNAVKSVTVYHTR
jgi:hypothetical protein